MKIDRLARFGRWTFYAGLIVGLGLGNLAAQVHWPFWVIVAVGFAVACIVRWLMGRIAERAAELIPNEVKPGT